MRMDGSRQPWVAQLLERKPMKSVTVRLANKTARIAWALMTRKDVYAATAARPRSSPLAEARGGGMV